MNKLLMLSLTAAVALLGISFSSALATPQSLSPAKFSGTYVVDVSIPAASAEFSLYATFNADGTVTTSDATDFSPGTFWETQSTAHGAWQMIGPRTLIASSVCMLYDATACVGTQRVQNAVVTFDNGFNTGAGTFEAAIIPLPGDPLDPNAPVAFTGTLSLRRMPAAF